MAQALRVHTTILSPFKVYEQEQVEHLFSCQEQRRVLQLTFSTHGTGSQKYHH